ncbi:T9SS type A sorting domain-containing protein [Fulvivirga ulvae]|uniref:T9SS type A sorting domain-containing protein n=1 Tax=Fulvivirga ulvae TaxID=2904245 RepID=UPI001F352141|nr:T9SS type A sorting domain-containing protein [Fulvivirga ulvae]UII30733.1 T9SS type A sorting domain-containing protein [Fulvivirga ulvae]
MKALVPLLILLTWLCNTPVKAQNLIPPANVKPVQISPAIISFSWEYPAGGHQGFIVERRQAQHSDFQVIADLAAEIYSYTDNNIENGVSYQYRVKVYSATEESPYSKLIEGPPSIKLRLDDKQKIATRKLRGILDISGVPELDYMLVSGGDKYGAVKLGYDEYAVYTANPLLLSGSGYQYLHLTLKNFSVADWNHIEFRLNDKGGAVIGNYLNNVDSLGDGWFKVKIPLNAFMEQQNVQFISFPNTFGGDFALREVLIVGNEASLQWFGNKKYDNAIKENVEGQARLIFKSAGILIEEVHINVINENNLLERASMPYSPINMTLVPGENLLYAMMTDTNGTVYYSDTVSYTVAPGPVLEVVNISCSGSSDGSIDLTMSGGVPPYTFQWSNGASSEDISGLSAGFYHLEVTDSEGKKAFANTIVEQPNTLEASLQQEDCTNDTRSLSITGGKAPYTYSIDNSSFQPVGTSDKEVWRVTGRENVWYKGLEETDVDGEDNVYIAGNYSGAIYFGNHSVGVDGAEGIYLAGFSAKGDFAWGVTFIGGKIAEMVVDKDGNTVLAFNILYGEGTMITHNQKVTLKKNGYLVRFNKKGYLDWIKVMPRDISNVGVDGMNNIYAVGKRTTPFFNGNVFNNIKGPSDLYLAKYSPQGQLVWARNIWGRNGEINHGMHISNTGEVYLTGGYETDIHFDDLRLQSTHHMDIYVVKYNSKGQAVWAIRGGGANHDDFGRNITISPGGKVYVVAHFLSSSSSFGNASFEQPVLVLASINSSDGSINWAKPYVLIEGYPTFDKAYDIEAGFNGELHVTGEMAWSKISNGSGYEFYTGSYLLKFDTDGTMLQRKTLGEYTYGEVFSPLAATSDNHLVHSEYNSGLSLVKYGPSMQREIQIDPEINQFVEVKDANNCIFIINNLVQGAVSRPEVCSVTADAKGSGNQIFWSDPAKESSNSYAIYRAPRGSDNFEQIWTTSALENTFVDNQVNTDKHGYSYKVGAMNKCGVESLSDVHKTIYLKTVSKPIDRVHLSWEPYEGIGYSGYRILRGTTISEMELLAEVPVNTVNYIDAGLDEDTLYYRVSIISPVSCHIQADEFAGVSDDQRYINSNLAVVYRKHNDDKNDILFYPNPGTDRVSLKFNQSADHYQLTMIDNRGRVVRKMDGVQDDIIIDRGALPPGIYTVLLQGNSETPLRGVVIFH